MTDALRASIGLFGKIPSKRDFVTLNMPSKLLHPWEAWLQAGMTEGAIALEADWREAFLVAPVWRFWLGGDCGFGRRIGVMMPSMDSAGRYFPLTIFMRAAEDTSLPAPAAGPQEASFAALEAVALSALDDGMSLEALIAGLRTTPDPHAVPNGITLKTHAELISAEPAGDCVLALASLQDAELDGTSFWWTAGGGDFAPAAYSAKGLPSPGNFKVFVLGRSAMARDPA
jgi:type VI secretion system protein ImpM